LSGLRAEAQRIHWSAIVMREVQVDVGQLVHAILSLFRSGENMVERMPDID